MHAVVETPQFQADVRAARLSLEEAEAIILFIARNPTTGVLIPETGGARKIRFAGRQKGKSGGYRVIIFWGGEDLPVFLLALYAKNERADLTAKERKEMRTYLAALPAAYRAGAREYAQGKK